MPETDDNSPLILDSRVCRILSLLQLDAPRLLGLLAAQHADEILLTPAVTGMVLGISEKGARRLTQLL